MLLDYTILLSASIENDLITCGVNVFECIPVFSFCFIILEFIKSEFFFIIDLRYLLFAAYIFILHMLLVRFSCLSVDVASISKATHSLCLAKSVKENLFGGNTNPLTKTIKVIITHVWGGEIPEKVTLKCFTSPNYFFKQDLYIIKHFIFLKCLKLEKVEF